MDKYLQISYLLLGFSSAFSYLSLPKPTSAMPEKFTLATGHKQQRDRVELPFPSTLHIMNEADDFGWRIQIEDGALVITQVNHNDSLGMVIMPRHANQVHVK